MISTTLLSTNIRSSTPLRYVLISIVIFSVLCQWQSTALQYEDNHDAQFYSESFDGDADYFIPSVPWFGLEKSVFGPLLFETPSRVSQPVATVGNRDPPLNL